MAKDKESTDQHKNLKAKRKRIIKVPVNVGMNTPVHNNARAIVVSENEAALFKHANNPLGDPEKI